MPISCYTCGRDSSWVPWYMVLVRESKPKGAVAETSGEHSSFLVCPWEQSANQSPGCDTAFSKLLSVVLHYTQVSQSLF